MKHFDRPYLAQSLCASMAGESILDSAPFKFLAGPRRVGKSSFMRRDLLPAAVNLGWQTVYVDLWAQRQASPDVLIREALFREAEKSLGAVQAAMRKGGATEITLSAGFTAFKFDPGAMSISPSSSLKDLIGFIILRNRAPLLLIVDEAQHALGSDGGMDAMFSLKACRDEFNQSPEWQECSGAQSPLMCLMTGSNRDKLARLCTTKNSPFFGSSVDSFALLDQTYVQFFAEEIARNTGGVVVLDVVKTMRIFDMLGRRPELLENVVSKAFLNGRLASLEADILAGATQLLQDIDDELETAFLALTPLQQAVFEVIATNEDFSPYAQASLEAYALKFGSPVSAASAQAAIEALRNADLLWKPAKGDYQLEDMAYRAWFLRRAQYAKHAGDNP